MRLYHAYGNVLQQFRKRVIKIRARAWWRVACVFKGISTGEIVNLPYQVKGFDCFFGFDFEWYRHHLYHASSGNAHQQFRKSVIKIQARAWWRVACLFKGISTGEIAKLPYQVKDLIASVASILNGIVTTFTMRLHHANGNVHQQFGKPVIKIRARPRWRVACLF